MHVFINFITYSATSCHKSTETTMIISTAEVFVSSNHVIWRKWLLLIKCWSSFIYFIMHS